MRLLIALLVAAFLAGCATVDYQAYEGKNNTYEGEGGSKVVVGGVDFWSNGAPPRKYSIIGMIMSDVGTGYGDEAVFRSAAASEIKKRGGDAAIRITNNAGVIRTMPNIYMLSNQRGVLFAVIKYVQ